MQDARASFSSLVDRPTCPCVGDKCPALPRLGLTKGGPICDILLDPRTHTRPVSGYLVLKVLLVKRKAREVDWSKNEWQRILALTQLRRSLKFKKKGPATASDRPFFLRKPAFCRAAPIFGLIFSLHFRGKGGGRP